MFNSSCLVLTPATHPMTYTESLRDVRTYNLFRTYDFMSYVRLTYLVRTTFLYDLMRKPLRWMIPPMVVPQKRLIFAALCTDLIDYFVVCFEQQCNAMRAV